MDARVKAGWITEADLQPAGTPKRTPTAPAEAPAA